MTAFPGDRDLKRTDWVQAGVSQQYTRRANQVALFSNESPSTSISLPKSAIDVGKGIRVIGRQNVVGVTHIEMLPSSTGAAEPSAPLTGLIV